MIVTDASFNLAPRPDAAGLARAFRANGHVRISAVLTHDCAEALYAEVRGRQDWRQVLNSGDKVFEFDRPMRAAMPADKAAELDRAVHAGAREGFQYRYETIRLPDGNLAPPAGLLEGFPRWLSADPVRTLLRDIVGGSGIDFADGQATAYSPGDFLTAHDDDVAGKKRVAAYVLGLTPTWRTEWGGLLLFHGGGSVAGQAPGFNTLDLFAVPQTHSVSYVTPSAAYRRYAITGWLRGA